MRHRPVHFTTRVTPFILATATLLALPQTAGARKPRPAPPPKVITVGVFYDERSLAIYGGERAMQHVGPLLIERSRVVFRESGIDPERYRWELVYSAALPDNFLVPEVCNIEDLLIKAVLDPRVQVKLKEHEIAVPIFLFTCHDVERRSGVSPVVPDRTADFARNVLIGVQATVTGSIYDPDRDELFGDTVFHEFGHSAGCRHALGQPFDPEPGRKPEPLFRNARGILLPPVGGNPTCDIMGIFCINQPFFSNLAFPGRGRVDANCAAAIIANWNLLADAPKGPREAPLLITGSAEKRAGNSSRSGQSSFKGT